MLAHEPFPTGGTGPGIGPAIETIMLSPSRHFRPHWCTPGSARAFAGFTLIETVIALAVLGTMAAGVYLGFNGINTYAVSSRLYSEAQTAAHNQIDLVLSKEPFDITAAKVSGSFDPTLNKIPVELMTIAELDALATTGSGSGPVVFPSEPPTSTPATTSTYYPYYPYYRIPSGPDAGKLAKQAFIYQDPVTGSIVVTGTLTTTITDTGIQSNFINANTDLNIRRANVSVSYTFRNRNYTVSMDTLRTADQ
jgi:prepilin-type N-terminal cleavage/methylation domain-containing protein